MEEYLTSSFKTALKAANRDKSTTDKHVQDKLLHRDLDKLVKEESKTNSKMVRVVKSTSGESYGSSRTKPSFSTKRYNLPPGNLPREVAEVPAGRREDTVERTLARRRTGKTRLRKMTKVRTNLHHLLRLSPRVSFRLWLCPCWQMRVFQWQKL